MKERDGNGRAGEVRRQELVAWILGELDADEAARVAAQVAADPALEAERAKLAGAAALVRQWGAGADPAPCEERREALDRAAAGARRGWRAAPLGWRDGLALAASLLLGVGLWALWSGRVEHALDPRSAGQPQDRLARGTGTQAMVDRDRPRAEAPATRPAGRGLLPERLPWRDPDATPPPPARGHPVEAARSLGYQGDPEPSQRSSQLRLVRNPMRGRVLQPRPPTAIQVQQWIHGCVRMPGESLEDYFFRSFGTRPFEATRSKPLSTFGADVDTASYTLARAHLDAGRLPPPETVRTEEWINAFRREYADERPEQGALAMSLELGPSRFGDPQRAPWMLRAALAAREVTEWERVPLALTLVVDVSGSMRIGARMEHVRRALEALAQRLDEGDRVSLVRFSNHAEVVVEGLHGGEHWRLEHAIAQLAPQGGTNLEAGLVLGYEVAARNFDPERQNRVVLLSDGVGNIGSTEAEVLLDRVAEQRALGIYLNTVGVGLTNHDGALLEALARGGEGICLYVDSEAEAVRALAEEFVGTFQTVARDVKLQVEFDPEQVGRWRLLGYENRQLADRQFRDDRVDGGEVNAGHTVVALYELEDVVLLPGRPLATFRARYIDPGQRPGEGVARELETAIEAAEALADFRATSPAFRLSASVAQAAEILRHSAHRRGAHLGELLEELEAVAGELKARDEGWTEPRALAQRLRIAGPAIEGRLAGAEPQEALLDELRFAHFELEVERSAPGPPDLARLAELEARIQSLEEALRALAQD